MAATLQFQWRDSLVCRRVSRWLVWAMVSLITGVAGAQNNTVPWVMMDGKRVHPTSILVKYGTRTTAATAGTVATAANLRVTREFRGLSRWAVLDLHPQAARPAAGQEAQALRDRITQLRQSGQFEYVEPDYVRKLSLTPADTFFLDGTLWGLRNFGQNGGTRGADLNVTNAWDITVGSTNVIVAVIDSGIRYTHGDLAAQMWRNPGEIAGDGIDNDGDGIVDDVFGFNALTGTGDPFDDNGHGTHVAGTIGAKGQLATGEGIAGINWTAKVMGFKFLNSGGSGDTSDAVYAFNKIAELKNAGTNFRVTNNSWGGGGFSQTLKDAMAAVEALGIVNVCAAGNSSVNADFTPMYPGAYDNRGIISVLASDSGDLGASFTNYGLASVDIAAPGVSTLSTSPTGTCSLCGTPVAPDLGAYKFLNGTSMASPHVAGAVAAMIQRNMNLNGGTSNLSAAQVRDMLLDPASYDVMTDPKAKSTSKIGRAHV